MIDDKQHYKIIADLKERERELRCLYKIEEQINKFYSEDFFLHEILKTIPLGWQYAEYCHAKIKFKNKTYKEPGWIETELSQRSDLVIDEKVHGFIEVFYCPPPESQEISFLPEEQHLLNNIASRISYYLFINKLKYSLDVLEEKKQSRKKLLENALLDDHNQHWRWRLQMAHIICEKLNFQKFGIHSIFLIGSVKEATAGPASDIDFIIYSIKKIKHIRELMAWFEGWSLCLSEVNYSRTGFRSQGLIDLHFITEDDLNKNASFTTMLKNNAAKLIKSISSNEK